MLVELYLKQNRYIWIKLIIIRLSTFASYELDFLLTNTNRIITNTHLKLERDTYGTYRL